MINKSRNDLPQVWKFLKSFITFPYEMFPKKNTAITEKMKSTSSSNRKTLANAPTDIVIVCKSAYKPGFLPASLRILLTLSTLMIRASWGPIDKAEFDEESGSKDIRMSMMEVTTMKKSNLFHMVLK